MAEVSGGVPEYSSKLAFRGWDGALERVCAHRQGGDHTHLVTSGPPILSGSSVTLAEEGRDRMHNWTGAAPPPPHCHQMPGSPCCSSALPPAG